MVLTGKVQGVGFRHFVRQKALEFNLAGWVKNKTDGTVEIEVVGDEEMILFFTDLLKTGNRDSSIDRIFKTELPVREKYISFFIKH